MKNREDENFYGSFALTTEQRINYDTFLFGMLLKDTVAECKEMEYDLLYELVNYLYYLYDNSDYNIDTKGAYECMEEFLADTETVLIIKD